MTLKRKRNLYVECTACYNGNFAEHLHPVLKVPICGECKLSVSARDLRVEEKNEVSCIWCGQSDGCELFMCDSCVHSFCTNCVARNFGESEANHVRQQDLWTCYLCSFFSPLAELQKSHDQIVFNSLDKLYAQLRPPLEQLDSEVIKALSAAERSFASIFSSEVLHSTFSMINISSYLKAGDLYGVIFRLSRGLRKFFQSRALFLPGLFQTPYGYEMSCRLYEHQQVSLNSMIHMENSSMSFGALRGGIFADEPGLGKTVTVLALIAATAGFYPQRPSNFWNEDELETKWAALSDHHAELLLPVVNRLLRSSVLADHKPQPIFLLNLRREINYPRNQQKITIRGFEIAVRSSIGEMLSLSSSERQILRDIFFFEMNKVKEKLDSKQRKVAHNRANKSRSAFERQLCPSSATLVVVPLALLEHWYEQILLHLNLFYFAAGDDKRGLVYLDGLGDIVDVEAPISRLQINPNNVIDCIEKVSNYVLVVTTIERCAMESKTCGLHEEDCNWQDITATSSALLQLRWLRLIVDEGHELTLEKPSKSSRAVHTEDKLNKTLYFASRFITMIAAERRWIMSGTPTTGASAESGLQKLFVLLSFLRHPDFGMASGSNAIASWKKNILEPCLRQDKVAWDKVAQIINKIMIRHIKDDLNLFRPIHLNVNLDSISADEDFVTGQASVLADDRAKAHHIVNTLRDAKDKWIKFKRQSSEAFIRSSLRVSLSGTPKLDRGNKTREVYPRRPKAIVFSQYFNDLQGVGHFLYSMLGDSNVCEHFGKYQSSELSRFRHSKRKFRRCPLCGCENGITQERYCEQILYLVEYIDFVNPWASGELAAGLPVPGPERGGHGAAGPGGHYVGRCLCSPIGCVETCNGYPNPFFDPASPQSLVNPNFALVSAEHIRGWSLGIDLQIGQEVYIIPQDASVDASGQADCSLGSDLKKGSLSPLLWSGGRMGGRAVIKQWRRCGGVRSGSNSSWHGSNILSRVRWEVEAEDAMVLLLTKDGSVGLDLSFATHIFLLERIHDPALRNQIISRAHRVGATGPVHVHLLQVVADSLPPADPADN
eukprot:gene6985-7727_t